MKFGMNLLLWTAKVDESHYRLLRELKEMGYDGVEVPVFEGTAKDYQKLGSVLRDLGLRATAVTVMSAETNPISADPKIQAAAHDRLRWVIDRCADLNAETLAGPLHSALGVFSGTGPTPAEIARGVAFFKDISRYSSGAGIQLAIEYLNRFENYFLTTAADTFQFLEQVDDPACGMMWDSFHGHIEEASIEPLRRIRPRLVHVHISENHRGTPGTGQVHWKETFSMLKEIGYDGWMTVEAFGRALPDLAAATRVWRDLFDNPTKLCQDSIRFMRAGCT